MIEQAENYGIIKKVERKIGQIYRCEEGGHKGSIWILSVGSICNMACLRPINGIFPRYSAEAPLNEFKKITNNNEFTLLENPRLIYSNNESQAEIKL
jgi:hypothetical protein